MTFRRAVLSLTMTAALIAVVTGCGGSDQTSPPVTDTPSSTTPAPTPTPTPTPVDPTVAAKKKILADYAAYATFSANGLLSNRPTFPYEQRMTGNALQAIKSVTAGMEMTGRRFTGSYKYLKGTVVALNLKTEPATATVRGCAYDAIVLRDKKGKVLTDPPSKTSTKDQLVLIGQRWMVTETQTLDAADGGC
jgi:hypothetical protein